LLLLIRGVTAVKPPPVIMKVVVLCVTGSTVIVRGIEDVNLTDRAVESSQTVFELVLSVASDGIDEAAPLASDPAELKRITNPFRSVSESADSRLMRTGEDREVVVQKVHGPRTLSTGYGRWIRRVMLMSPRSLLSEHPVFVVNVVEIAK
jgi:hypothetical protein